MGRSHGNRCISSRQAMISALKFSSLLHKPKLTLSEAVLMQSRDLATEIMASEIALIVALRRCKKIILCERSSRGLLAGCGVAQPAIRPRPRIRLGQVCFPEDPSPLLVFFSTQFLTQLSSTNHLHLLPARSETIHHLVIDLITI